MIKVKHRGQLGMLQAYPPMLTVWGLNDYTMSFKKEQMEQLRRLWGRKVEVEIEKDKGKSSLISIKIVDRSNFCEPSC